MGRKKFTIEVTNIEKVRKFLRIREEIINELGEPPSFCAFATLGHCIVYDDVKDRVIIDAEWLQTRKDLEHLLFVIEKLKDYKIVIKLDTRLDHSKEELIEELKKKTIGKNNIEVVHWQSWKKLFMVV